MFLPSLDLMKDSSACGISSICLMDVSLATSILCLSTSGISSGGCSFHRDVLQESLAEVEPRNGDHAPSTHTEVPGRSDDRHAESLQSAPPRPLQEAGEIDDTSSQQQNTAPEGSSPSTLTQVGIPPGLLKWALSDVSYIKPFHTQHANNTKSLLSCTSAKI